MPEVGDRGAGGGLVPSEAEWENPLHASPQAAGGLLAISGILGGRSITPISAFVFTVRSPRVRDCAQMSPSQKDIGHIGLGAHPNPAGPHLN